jgi:hypothetical protein
MMTSFNANLGDEDFATGLRQSLATRAADVRMPPDLLDRAVARNRKRTTRNRLIGAAGMAAVVATGTVTALSLSHPEAAPPPATAQHAVDAGYVLQQVAAAEVNSYRMISLTQEAGSGTTYTDVATQQQRTVFDSDPSIQMANVIKNGVWTDTTIDSQHNVYSVVAASAKDHGVSAVISSLLPLQDRSDPATAYQAALKEGIITVAGHRNLGGRDTILLLVKQSKYAKLAPPTANKIWIDASTYQVVQTENFVPVAINKKTGNPYNGMGPIPSSGIQERWKPVTTRVSWLPPTSENLAKLTISPPAGYTQIPWTEMATKYLAPIS